MTDQTTNDQDGDQDDQPGGRIFRALWIDGVGRHYPGDPKPGYIAPWNQTPAWEQDAATAVYDQITAFIHATNGNTRKLTREQKGRFVALCWIGQIHTHFENPKPAYIADWEDMPDWQRKTDADIFETIENDHRRIGAEGAPETRS